MLVDVLAREKNVPRDIVFGALEMALASATKKKYAEDIDVRVHVDRNTGAYETFRRWKVLPDDTPEWNTAQMLSVEEAQDRGKSDAKVDDVIEQPIANVEFGRIGAQTAKQVILQRIRDAEREQILNDFLSRSDELVTGTVKRMERGSSASRRPDSMTALPRSMRFTVPVTSSSPRDRKSFRICSRSASRMRCRITCFAVCAPMRPNSIGSSGSSMNSSSLTSALRFCASDSGICAGGVSSASSGTTFQRRNDS